MRIIKSSFDKYYTEKDGASISEYFLDYLRYMKSGKRVLDVGCGTGKGVDFLVKMGVDCYGIDISKVAVKKAAEKAHGRVFMASITEIPFRENTFDVVGCHWVLEHVEDVDKALNEMVRVTKVNGFVVIYTYNYTNFFKPWNVILYLIKKRAYVYSGPYPTKHGTYNGSRPVLYYIEDFLKKNGCIIIEKITCKSASLWKEKIARILRLTPLIKDLGPQLFIVARKHVKREKKV
jgi:ubiquinone/menaquinone biosynthesis C-methylase UbiE